MAPKPRDTIQVRVTFQLFATPKNDLFPQYFSSCAFWMMRKQVSVKKMATDEDLCVL